MILNAEVIVWLKFRLLFKRLLGMCNKIGKFYIFKYRIKWNSLLNSDKVYNYIFNVKNLVISYSIIPN